MIQKIIELCFRIILDGNSFARRLGVKVGTDCRIFTTSFGSEPWLIEIGNKVTVTSGVKILTHDGPTWLFNDEKGRRFLFKKTIIRNNVFIGVNSIIMPGVVIEDNVIVAAGSIVTKSVPSGVIIGGNPAKILGDYDTYKAKVFSGYVSESDMDFTKTYKERVLEIVDQSVKPYLKK
jgi:acetyltransferase-like isoleucine patch superfamily enzyme